MPRQDGSPTVAEIIAGAGAYYDESNSYYEGEIEMHLTNVKFNKTGAEIVASLNKKVEGLQAKAAETQGKIETVCKARELDPNEVIEAGEDAEKVATYSNKMSNSLGNGSYQNVPKTVIEALQADINNLRVWGSRIARLKGDINECLRVKNNIKGDTTVFVLDYSELVALGF